MLSWAGSSDTWVIERLRLLVPLHCRPLEAYRAWTPRAVSYTSAPSPRFSSQPSGSATWLFRRILWNAFTAARELCDRNAPTVEQACSSSFIAGGTSQAPAPDAVPLRRQAGGGAWGRSRANSTVCSTPAPAGSGMHLVDGTRGRWMMRRFAEGRAPGRGSPPISLYRTSGRDREASCSATPRRRNAHARRSTPPRESVAIKASGYRLQETGDRGTRNPSTESATITSGDCFVEPSHRGQN